MMMVGDGTYGAEFITELRYDIYDSETIIGKYCSIAPNVKIFLGGNHRYSRDTTYPFNAKYGFGSGKVHDGYSNGNVIIGNDVWIGQDVTIMSGVTIGNGAVIAAGTVVTKNVGSYEIVGGNPSRLIKHRFTQDQISALEKIKWWDWPLTQIKENADFLMGDSIDDFINKFSK